MRISTYVSILHPYKYGCDFSTYIIYIKVFPHINYISSVPYKYWYEFINNTKLVS